MPTRYCPYCASPDLTIWRVIGSTTLYKCGACNRTVITPIVMPDKVQETEVAEVAEKFTE